MSIWKRLLILKLCFKIVLLSLIVPVKAYAFDPVAQPDRVTRAVSGVLLEGMRSRGFTANDPRVYNTEPVRNFVFEA